MKIAWLAYKTNEVVERYIQEEKDYFDEDVILDEDKPDWEKNNFEVSKLDKPYNPDTEDEEIEEEDSESFSVDNNLISKEERDYTILSYVFKKAYNPFILDTKTIGDNSFGKGFKDTLIVSPREFYRLKKDLFVFQDETSNQFKKIFEEAENNFSLKDYFDEEEIIELTWNIPAGFYPFFLPNTLKEKVIKSSFIEDDYDKNMIDKYLGGGLAATHLVDKIINYVWVEQINIPSEIVLGSNWLRGIDIITLPAIELYNKELIGDWLGQTEEYFLTEYTTNSLVRGFITYFLRPEEKFSTLIRNLPKKDQEWLSSLEEKEQKKFFEGAEQGQNCLRAIIYNWQQEQKK